MYHSKILMNPKYVRHEVQCIVGAVLDLLFNYGLIFTRKWFVRVMVTDSPGPGNKILDLFSSCGSGKTKGKTRKVPRTSCTPT
ncbi:ATP-dependent zinc metalloprotease FTSH 6, chloroplastic [Frankliniella fusca]|uniref:ATP-dependent zinc metalloprotease FTSH 6, chloroplastic n=1 Tax=Frankliniella fusca TaxID=407009 RepID=A0AAE1LC12_9NEOP|nr:ATP-dependent zinc metalloprotease FTSH 6, chloroplastic [Frankliniella fusca]